MGELCRCVRGDRCATQTRADDGTWIPAHVPTTRPVCDADLELLRDAIEELPELYMIMELRRPATTGGGDPFAPGRRGAPTEPPIPIRAHIDAAQATMHYVLQQWACRILTLLWHRPVQPVENAPHTGEQVTAYATLLATHVSALVALRPEDMWRVIPLAERNDYPAMTTGWVYPDQEVIRAPLTLGGADAVHELLLLRSRARAIAGELPRLTRIPGIPCPRCDCLGLVAEADNPSARRCEACRAYISPAEYAAHLTAMMEMAP